MTSSEQNNLERSLRMRFYGKIKEKGEFSETFISPPPHWINSNIFSVDPKFDSSPHKNKSIITILSIWNTMIGSSIVSVPYCVYHAGLIPTVILCILYGLICYYTCQVVVKTGGNDNDYSDTVHRFIGPKYGFAGRVTQISFNLLINSGATFIYFLIIK